MILENFFLKYERGVGGERGDQIDSPPFLPQKKLRSKSPALLGLKNNIFQFYGKTLKQLRGTAIGIKFSVPYAVLFMTDLEERILQGIELQSRM